jgi:hypothetical protein
VQVTEDDLRILRKRADRAKALAATNQWQDFCQYMADKWQLKPKTITGSDDLMAYGVAGQQALVAVDAMQWPDIAEQEFQIALQLFNREAEQPFELTDINNV